MVMGMLVLLAFPLVGCSTGYQLPASLIAEDG
jgi:hypothetical protein